MADTPQENTAPTPMVLIVDDARDGRESCADYLSFRGYRVATAEDGEEALDRAFELRPDIILMDLRLPKMDGLEATMILKKDERTRAIPIIAVTAHALPTTHEEAIAAGCESVITKPCAPRELEAAIRDELGVGSTEGSGA
jgi:CheY-like chemotaxis protein